MTRLYLIAAMSFFMGALACGFVRDAQASRVIYVFVERYESSQILSPPNLSK